MKTTIFTLAISLAILGAATAASVTNQDAQSHVLIVTEAGDKIELVIEAGATVNFCPSGCFVTMPSGDKETLGGAEKVEIENGKLTIE